MEDEEILTQDEDDLEEEMMEIEEEEKKNKPKPKKEAKVVEEVNEVYEGFAQPARLGIVNTITGATIEGFEQGKDEGMIQVLKLILNKLDKIEITSGV